MNLDQAQSLAVEILAQLKPLCRRAEVDGSLRRCVPEPNDIEIVAVPHPDGLVALRELVNHRWGAPEVGAFPAKYTRIRSAHNIDFFWATPQTWGLNYFIRCGSAQYVAGALAHWKRITGGGYSEACQLHRADGTLHPTPEEADVFAALGIPFARPDDRTYFAIERAEAATG